MTNNKGMNRPGNSGDDKVARIARIVITLAVVIIVGYMVSRADKISTPESNVAQTEAEVSDDNKIKDMIENLEDTEPTGAIVSPESDGEDISAEEIEDISEIEIEDETSAEIEEVSEVAEEDSADVVLDSDDNVEAEQEYVEYRFRNKKYLNQHYEKHGIEMGFGSAEEYEKAACDVINNPDALYKTEAEDGDGVYYVEATNEFAILSTDGYIRTYFNPSGGKAYFERQ